MTLKLNKFYGSVGVVDAANADNVYAGTSIDVYVVRAGASCVSALTLSTSVAALCDSKGGLVVGDQVKVLDSSGSLSAVTLTIGSISEAYIAATDTALFTIGFSLLSGGSSVSVSIGDRLVLASHTTTGNQVQLYNTGNTLPTNQVSQPISTDSEGNFSFYADADSVDLYFSGSSITDGYHVVDLKTWPKTLQDGFLKRQQETAATSIALEPDIVVLELTTSGTTIQTITGCYPGRLVFVTGEGATTVSVDTVTSVSANKVVVQSGAADPIAVPATGVLPLIGAEEGGTFYWKAVRAESLTLAEISGVSLSSVTNGDPLVYNGTNWVNASSIGTTANPLSEINSSAVKVVDGSGNTATVTFSGSTDRSLTLPDGAGEILTNAATQIVTGSITFDDDSFTLRDPVGATKRGRFDMGNVTPGSTRVITFPDEDVDVAKLAAARAINIAVEFSNTGLSPGCIPLNFPNIAAIDNGLFLLKPNVNITITRVIIEVYTFGLGTPSGTLQLYEHPSLPTVATVPPAGTAILSSAADVSAIGGTAWSTILDTTSFSNADISAGNYVFLGIASALTPPNQGSMWITIEYKVT